MAVAGRIALITGGGSGIGKAVAKLFAENGAKLAVCDLKFDGKQELADSHLFEQADVSKSDSVNAVLSKVIERYGSPPDIVVNAAGITRDRTLLKLTEEDWDAVINVNLKGTFNVAQICAKAMVAGKVSNGSIVSISSVVGKYGNIGQTNYAASKAGVIGLTKSISKELGRFGIRANAVLPGFIETPMTAAVPDHLLEIMKMQTPLQRVGKPEEVAELCLFLASNRSSFITGSAIEVSGGLAF